MRIARPKWLGGLMVSLMAVVALPAQAATDPAATVDAFHAALHAGKRDLALSLLAPDVSMYEQGFVESSRNSYSGGHITADMLFAKDTSYKVTERHMLWFGDSAACVMSQTTTRGQFQGQTIDLIGTETVVLRKAGDGWAIVHIHTSAHPRSKQDGDQ